jgi:hypothetical protein
MIFSRVTSGSPKSRPRRSLSPSVDALEGRRLLSTADPVITYFPDGHVQSEVDTGADGGTFSLTYDDAGHNLTFTAADPAGKVEWTQDQSFTASGIMTSRVISYSPTFGNADLAGNTYAYTFRATTGTVSSASFTYADGSTASSTFNAAGQQTSEIETDGNGDLVSSSTFSYYADGHLKSFRTTNADNSGNGASFSDDGKVTAMTSF